MPEGGSTCRRSFVREGSFEGTEDWGCWRARLGPGLDLDDESDMSFLSHCTLVC